MAISGPEALRSLDDAVRDIRREEEDITKRLARTAERIGKLRETEAELFRELAEIRLSPDVRENMSGRLLTAEKRAHQMIAAHGKELQHAEQELRNLDRQVADKSDMRRKIADQIDGAQNDLKALADKISAAIARNPEYSVQREALDELDKIAEQSVAKTELSESDREQKGRPYRDDPLFMYLWEAGYGTKNYQANNLVRWLDSIVARMVRYHDARPNFSILNEIPLRLREHAERQLEKVQIAEAALDQFEQDAIDAAGGKPFRETLINAQKELEALDEQMSTIEDARDSQARNLRHLAEGRDPAFEEAHSLLAQSLGQQDLHTLLQDARQTRTRDDDRLVSRIDDTRARIIEEDEETSDQKRRLKTLAVRRRELEDIEWEFKKQHFDDPRSVFRDNDLAGDLLGEFLRGAISATSYWGEWRNSQSWRPGTSDWAGGVGLPRSGRTRSKTTRSPWSNSSSSSGGFSRPRAGSRGSRKSGGFKTGGGF